MKIDKSSQLYFREEVEDLCEIHDDAGNVNEIIQSIIDRQEQFDVNDPDNLPPRICLLLDDISSYLNRDSLVRKSYFQSLSPLQPHIYTFQSNHQDIAHCVSFNGNCCVPVLLLFDSRTRTDTRGMSRILWKQAQNYCNVERR